MVGPLDQDALYAEARIESLDQIHEFERGNGIGYLLKLASRMYLGNVRGLFSPVDLANPARPPATGQRRV